MIFFRLLVASMLCQVFTSNVLGQSIRTQTPDLWQGEELSQSEGVIAFQSRVSRSLSQLNIQRAVVRLYRPAAAMHYLLDQPVNSPSVSGGNAWRLPAGRYQLVSIDFYRGENFVARWYNREEEQIVIEDKAVLNLGHWHALPLPNRQIRVVFRKDQQFTISRQSPPSQSPPPRSPPAEVQVPLLPSARQRNPGGAPTSITPQSLPVLPGAPARPTQRPLGQAAAVGNAGLPGDEGDLRSSYRAVRQIVMSYQVDILRLGRYNSVMIQTLNRRDAELRQCYLDRLEDNESLAGSITFKFLLSGRRQTIQSMQAVRQTVNDRRLIECLYWKVLALSFPINEGLVGEMTFEFATRE